jgi:hypothetical protein
MVTATWINFHFPEKLYPCKLSFNEVQSLSNAALTSGLSFPSPRFSRGVRRGVRLTSSSSSAKQHHFDLQHRVCISIGNMVTKQSIALHD